MKEEILSIADDALKAIDEFENFLFANHRAKYAMSKSILDQHREHITTIKKGLELELDDASFSAIKSDLDLIINDVKSARSGNYELKEPEIDTTQIDQMLDSLNTDRVELKYPKEDIAVDGISNTIDNLQNMSSPNNVPELTAVPEIPTAPVTPQGNDAMVNNVTPEVQNVFNAQPMEAPQVPTFDPNAVAQAPQAAPTNDISSDIDVAALDAFMSNDNNGQQ